MLYLLFATLQKQRTETKKNTVLTPAKRLRPIRQSVPSSPTKAIINMLRNKCSAKEQVNWLLEIRAHGSFSVMLGLVKSS
jgi:hypothetical protein